MQSIHAPHLKLPVKEEIMAEQSLSQLTPIINDNDLKFIESNGKILFSTEEIGRQLGYRNPSKSVNMLYSRNQAELVGYAVGIKLMSTDGKYYEVRHFTEEGVYILSMLANTPRAAVFRAQLARLLRELRERRVEAAREAGYTQGRDEALALPAVEKERKAAYLKGMAEGKRLQIKRDGLNLLTRILDYRAKGLTQGETARLLGISHQRVSDLLARARKLGLMPTSPVRPVQGNLLEVGA